MDKVHSGPVGASIPGGSEDGGAAYDPRPLLLAKLATVAEARREGRMDYDRAREIEAELKAALANA